MGRKQRKSSVFSSQLGISGQHLKQSRKEPQNCGQHLMKRWLIQRKVISLVKIYLWHYKFLLRNNIKREKKMCYKRDTKHQSQEKLRK